MHMATTPPLHIALHSCPRTGIVPWEGRGLYVIGLLDRTTVRAAGQDYGEVSNVPWEGREGWGQG